jgi:antitoxin component HigA of HigAB toxin-antitoxin module
MKQLKTVVAFSDLPRDYRKLCELSLPRPIHDKVGYENALEIVEAMAGFEDKFSRGQADYFELLTDLILAYEKIQENEHAELPLKKRLATLLEATGWNASDLGRFLQLDATMGNKILRGERKLTAEHIRKLSMQFSLSADYFLGD